MAYKRTDINNLTDVVISDYVSSYLNNYTITIYSKRQTIK